MKLQPFLMKASMGTFPCMGGQCTESEAMFPLLRMIIFEARKIKKLMTFHEILRLFNRDPYNGS